MPKTSAERLTKRAVEAAPPGSYLWDSEVRGFGVRTTAVRKGGQSGSRSFVFRYTVPDPKPGRPDHRKQRFDTLGGFPSLTVEQARDLARARAAKGRDVDHRGERKRTAEERSRAKTVHDLGLHYLGTYAKERGLRPATLKSAKHLLSMVPDSLGAKPVEEVAKPEVQRLHAQVREDVSVYQANRLLAVLARMFTLAEENGWRTLPNPCRGVKKGEEKQRWRNLSEGEVARLLAACEAYPGAMLDGVPEGERGAFAGLLSERENSANAVRLLLYTGARLQEVLKADWGQFDLERGRWTKPSSHTKTKRDHLVDLAGPALDLLREMRTADPLGRFLFPGEPREVSPGTFEARARADLKRPWRWIVREAGLEDVRLHDLRRTTASFMLSDGASLATVGSALGHTQAATTQRYAHLSQDVQREALKRAGERMAALRGTAKKADVMALARGC